MRIYSYTTMCSLNAIDELSHMDTEHIHTPCIIIIIMCITCTYVRTYMFMYICVRTVLLVVNTVNNDLM